MATGRVPLTRSKAHTSGLGYRFTLTNRAHSAALRGPGAAADEAVDSQPEAMLKAVRERGAKSVFIDFLLRMDGRMSRDTILAAILTTIAWGPLVHKRISLLTAETLSRYLRLYGVTVGSNIPAEHHQWGSLCGISQAERYGQRTMADLCYLAIPGRKPTAAQGLPL